MGTPHQRVKKWVALMASGWAFSSAFAATLGELNVVSRLGEPLTAYVRVEADAGEMRSLAVRLADEGAYREAGITPSPLLPQLKARLIRQGAGWAVELKTNEPVREPFVNVLLDLRWNGGRILREYAILIDPPEYALPAQPIVARPVALPAGVEKRLKAAASFERAAPVTTAEGRTVKAGETLMQIAREVQPSGVPLEVVLYALWQKNPEAFIAKDMNRLQAGARLRLPSPDELAAIPVSEARSVLRTQVRSFARHQQQVAATPAQVAALEGSAAKGKVVSRAEVTAPQDALKPADQVEVQPTRLIDAGKAARSAQGGQKGGETVPIEDWLALKANLQETQERIAQLERQLAKMSQLLEVQSALLAQLQQQSSGAVALQGEKKASPEKASAQPPAEPPQQAESTPAAPTPAKEAAREPAPPPTAAKERTPQEAAPTPPSRSVEPSIVDFVLEEPLLLAGGGGALLLLAALLLRRRKEKGEVAAAEAQAEVPATPTATVTTASQPQPSELKTLSPEPTPSRLTAASGQEVDTSASILGADFTQVAFNALQADEGIDPVTEAEVLLAYDRDQQAEEILLDALKETPNRPQIPLKLLEIYGKRGDRDHFDHYFGLLAALTGQSGKDWERGLALHERFFGPVPEKWQRTVSAAADKEEEILAFDEEQSAPPPSMLPMEEQTNPPAEQPVASEPEALDFTLGRDLPEAPQEEPEAPQRAEEPAVSFEIPLELELPAAPETTAQPEPVAETPSHPEQPAAEEEPKLDLDLDFDLDLESTPPAAEKVAEEITLPDLDLDFAPDVEKEATAPPPAAEEVSLPEFSPAPELLKPSGAAEEPPPEKQPRDSELDLSDLPDVDLGTVIAEGEGEPDREIDDSRIQLAQAYLDMEDFEGARELLEEVMRDGTPEAKAKAEELLAQLPQ
ncbi:hypothetical protein JCM16106_02620 [Hydrogenophilus islandicus]